MIAFGDVSDAPVQGRLAPAGTPVFLRVRAGSSGITVIGKDLRRAAKPFDVEQGIGPAVLYSLEGK